MYEEKDVYAILGLEQPAEENPAPEVSENSAEVASGAGAGGEEGREVAEPGQQVEGSGNTDLDYEEPEEKDGEEKPEQSREERSRHAAERRRAEQKAAIDAALQQQKAEHDKQIAALIAAMNLTDPNTGKPVTTLEELNAVQKEQQQRQMQKNLREGKLLPEDLQAMIRSEMETQAQEAKPQQQEKPAGNAAFQEKVAQELAEINKLDSSVKTLEDIMQLETAPAFAAAVKRGATFLEAFQLANFDRLQKAGREESARRAKQAALNDQRSKEHLTGSSQKGSGAVSVPADTLAMYRMLLPGKSDDEITAHYNRTLKNMK
jgi:hypothetical protein